MLAAQYLSHFFFPKFCRVYYTWNGFIYCKLGLDSLHLELGWEEHSHDIVRIRVATINVHVSSDVECQASFLEL
jgi:hypothetical protein